MVCNNRLPTHRVPLTWMFAFPKAALQLLYTFKKFSPVFLWFWLSSQQNHQKCSGHDVTIIPLPWWKKNSQKISGSLSPVFNPWADEACWTGGKMSSWPKMIIHLSLAYILIILYVCFSLHMCISALSFAQETSTNIKYLCFKNEQFSWRQVK